MLKIRARLKRVRRVNGFDFFVPVPPQNPVRASEVSSAAGAKPDLKPKPRVKAPVEKPGTVRYGAKSSTTTIAA